MIKNLLTAAAIALLAAGSAFAQQTVFIGTQGYDKLQDAVNAVEDNGTITIKGTCEISARVNFNADGKTITVKGEEGTNATIKSAANFTGNMLLITGTKANQGSIVNFESLIIDGANVARSQDKPIEVANNSRGASFTNCTFQNFNANRVVFAQRPVTVTGVTAKDCTLTTGVIYAGINNNVTVAGASEYSVAIEKRYAITAGDNLSGKITLNLITTGEEGTSGYTNPYDGSDYTVVRNCTNPELFEIGNAPEGQAFKLEAVNGTLKLVKDEPIVYVVKNETANTEFASFKDAYDAANANDVLVILEDVTLGDRILIEKALTIKGSTPEVKIIRNFTNKLLFGVKTSTSFENLVIDCNDQENSQPELQVDNNATFTMKNVKIVNSKSSNCLIDVKVYQTSNRRTLVLDNVTKENCTNTTPDIKLAGHLILSGDNNLSVAVNDAVAEIAVNGELTNEQPIELTLATIPELGTIIVSGTTDYKKFTVTNEGFYLNPDKDNNNLVLGDQKTTGIEDVVVDENAPVEYYNLSGMRVNGDNMAPGVYIKRQGAKATKVYVK